MPVSPVLAELPAQVRITGTQDSDSDSIPLPHVA